MVCVHCYCTTYTIGCLHWGDRFTELEERNLACAQWSIIENSIRKLSRGKRIEIVCPKKMSKFASTYLIAKASIVKKCPNFLTLFLFVSMKLDTFRMIFSNIDHCGLRATFDIKESFLLQPKTWHGHRLHCVSSRAWLETIQDFLIKLGIKPLMHLLEISIFSLNNDIVRLTKIMNNLVKGLKILSFNVIFLCLKLVQSFKKRLQKYW